MRGKVDVRTDYLFAMPSIIAGIARAWDLFGKFDDYNTSKTEREADFWALYSDWRITGQDLRDAALKVLDESIAETEPRQRSLFEAKLAPARR